LSTELNVAEPYVRDAWTRAKAWDIDARYEIGRESVDVLEFLDAVAGRRGVLPWLKRYW
jgi:hypothetical protein